MKPPRPKTAAQGIGQQAEDMALAWLQTQGLRLIARNYHSRYGEIDLILLDRKTLVFVEVRYRRSRRHGSAAESVTRQKQARLLNTAACFLRDYRHDGPSRFDVAALEPGPEGLSLDWIRDAFQAG